MKKIFITGNLGANAELRASKDGENFCTFSVGVAVGTKQSPRTDWVSCSINGKRADSLAKYLTKGTKVLVCGYPTVDAYLSKDGKPMGNLKVYVDDIELMGSKETGESKDTQVHEPMELESDNIPF